VTRNVKLVAVVPEPGETDAFVRLPLSGQLMARTDVGNASSDKLNHVESASAPTRVIRYRCGTRRGNADSGT
jgi:hypothetical protein